MELTLKPKKCFSNGPATTPLGSSPTRWARWWRWSSGWGLNPRRRCNGTRATRKSARAKSSRASTSNWATTSTKSSWKSSWVHQTYPSEYLFVEKIRPFRPIMFSFYLSEPVCWRRRWLQVRGEEWPWATSGQTQPQHRGWAGGSISGVGVGRASRRGSPNLHRETKDRHARQRQTCSDDRQVRRKGYDITFGKFVTFCKKCQTQSARVLAMLWEIGSSRRFKQQHYHSIHSIGFLLQ